MRRTGLDVYALEETPPADAKKPNARSDHWKAQLGLSVMFLAANFVMLGAMFAEEVSDTVNMRTGESSLMRELQILFGVYYPGSVVSTEHVRLKRRSRGIGRPEH